MTKSLITLPSERYAMYEKQLAEKDSAIANITAEKDAALSEKDAALSDLSEMKSEIEELKGQLAEAKAK